MTGLRRTWLLISLGALCATLSLITFASLALYSRNTFAGGWRGDGVLLDDGFWSFPRYSVLLPAMTVDGPSSKSYQFGGVPRANYSLRLYFDESASKMPGRSATGVDLRENGSVVATCSLEARQWVTCQTPREAGGSYLWTPELRDVRLRPQSTYTLTVRVSPDRATRCVIRPVLCGGGTELP